MACILIVNENKDTRDLFEFVLSANNQIITAADGFQAINLFDKYQPTIVIIHTILPIINGAQVVKHMRTIELATTVIATSSNCAGTFSQNMMLQAGADLCLNDPVDIRVIQAVVQGIEWPQITVSYKSTPESRSYLCQQMQSRLRREC